MTMIGFGSVAPAAGDGTRGPLVDAPRGALVRVAGLLPEGRRPVSAVRRVYPLRGTVHAVESPALNPRAAGLAALGPILVIPAGALASPLALLHVRGPVQVGTVLIIDGHGPRYILQVVVDIIVLLILQVRKLL